MTIQKVGLLGSQMRASEVLCASVLELRHVLSQYDCAGKPRHRFQRGGAGRRPDAYIGAHGGIASAKAPSPFRSGNGFDGGIQAGYNIQAGPAVFGAEIDGSYLGGTRHDVNGGSLKEKWRAAAKAKAGLSFDQTLVYGTAGVALTKFDKSDSLNSADERKVGYLVGAGVEQGFAGGLSARLEYNYVRTPDVETTSIYGGSKKDINSQELKAGINYRF